MPKRQQSRVWTRADIKPIEGTDPVRQIQRTITRTEQGRGRMTIDQGHAGADLPILTNRDTDVAPVSAPKIVELAKSKEKTRRRHHRTVVERLGPNALDFSREATPELVAARVELSEAIERFNQPDCTDIPLWFEREIDYPMGQALWERVRGEDINNRTITDGQVEGVLSEILGGRWQANGDSIRLTVNGQVIDGQGRLAAFLLACKQRPGLTIKTDVRFRVPPEAFVTIDTGKGRTAGDMMSMSKISNGYALGAMARMWHHYHKGVIRSQPKITPGLALEIVTRDKKLFEKAHALARQAQLSEKDFPIPVGVGGFLAMLALRADEHRAKQFFEQLITGENLKKGDAVWVLLRTLRNKKAGRRKKADRLEVTALGIKALNAFFLNQDVYLLKWNSNEPFPEFIPDQGRNIPQTEFQSTTV